MKIDDQWTEFTPNQECHLFGQDLLVKVSLFAVQTNSLNQNVADSSTAFSDQRLMSAVFFSIFPG